MARAVDNVHYVADVGASIAIAAALAWGLARIAGRPEAIEAATAVAPPSRG